jgi:hypothetical protein
LVILSFELRALGLAGFSQVDVDTSTGHVVGWRWLTSSFTSWFQARGMIRLCTDPL